MNSKLIIILLLGTSLAGFAETEEVVNKRFAVHSGGKLVVDVSFGSIEVTTNETSEVIVNVTRTIGRGSKDVEMNFFRDHPVSFSQEGDAVSIRSQNTTGSGNSRSWFGSQRTEGKYTISVPSAFQAQLKTSGGSVAVSDLTGEVKAVTSGGSLKFGRLRGPLDGKTSGGSIRATDCQGALKVKTSGGGIEVSGGSGSLEGNTSGGSVTVRDFDGPAHVGSSGGGITLENVTGKVEASTSGGSISARFSSPLAEPVSLSTSGGGVTLRVPEKSAFDLDAVTSGGGVSSDLPVTTTGKKVRDHLQGPVNGGGKAVILRTHGGSIKVRKF
ncbi:MAG: DUF4097 family beta strand repeat protein [Opitutaceae bacterium]|nr:DUF4097 family beta strand repeat protein [Verrucomicrobiales bacterium]